MKWVGTRLRAEELMKREQQNSQQIWTSWRLLEAKTRRQLPGNLFQGHRSVGQPRKGSNLVHHNSHGPNVALVGKLGVSQGFGCHPAQLLSLFVTFPIDCLRAKCCGSTATGRLQIHIIFWATFLHFLRNNRQIHLRLFRAPLFVSLLAPYSIYI